MGYPQLGYNDPTLMLGQTTTGLSPNYMSANAAYTGPDLSFGGNYSGLGATPNYQAVADATGFDLGGLQPKTNGLSNFLSNNADLLKAGGGFLVGGFGAWNGFQQNKLLKQSLQMQASQFREQMDISKQNINRNLEDRQAARVAANPRAYESVSDYMKKYGVK